MPQPGRTRRSPASAQGLHARAPGWIDGHERRSTHRCIEATAAGTRLKTCCRDDVLVGTRLGLNVVDDNLSPGVDDVNIIPHVQQPRPAGLAVRGYAHGYG